MGFNSDDAKPRPKHAAPATSRVPAFNFSFALGGWLMIYNFGVAKCLMDHGLHKVQPEKQSIIGSSAGSLSAAALVLEADIDKIVDQAKTSFIPRAHNAKIFGFVYGMFFIGTFLKESMLECLPVSRVPEKTSIPGRLVVVMSSLLGWGSIRAKEFDDGQELIDALRCSCAIFPLVMPHRFRGKRCFDGFFSEGTSAPTLDEEEAAGLETVTISPFYASSASIRPSRYVPLSWIALAPRDPAAIDWLYDLGYRDALFWMAKKGIEHTCTHHPRRSKEHQKTSPDNSSASEGMKGGGGGGGGCVHGGHSHSESVCGSRSDSVGVGVGVGVGVSISVGVGVSGGGSGSVSDNLGAGKSTLQEGGSDDDDDDEDRGLVGDVWNSAKDLPSPSKSSGAAAAAGGGDNGGGGGASAATIAGKIESSSVGGAGGGVGGGGSEDASGGGGAAKGIGGGYLRKSFVLSGCRMRPQRERHPQLDEPAFVPSLEQFVGHGSYHAVADFLFVVFFNIAWRPATALLLYADLISRLSLATTRGVWKELRQLLWWLLPALILAVASIERGPTGRECLAALAAVGAVVAVASSREGSVSAREWRTARRCVRGLFDRRILLSCLPWGHRGNVRSEALENSLLYRAVSFFM